MTCLYGLNWQCLFFAFSWISAFNDFPLLTVKFLFIYFFGESRLACLIYCFYFIWSCFRERVHVPSHSLVMLASTACRTSWSTSPSTMASASISSVWVSVSCRSSFFPWGETNHLLQCMSHPFTVKAYWFCPVTHLLNTGALMESSCRNSRFDFIHILISCADWRFRIFIKYPSKNS